MEALGISVESIVLVLREMALDTLWGQELLAAARIVELAAQAHPKEIEQLLKDEKTYE